MGFKTKAQQAQRNRWKIIKQAQLQVLKKEKPEPEHFLLKECIINPESAEHPQPEEQHVIKTESIEIFHELLPPEEPAETHPLSENPFCCLCLRIYSPDQFVQISPQQSWNCLDVVEVQSRLSNVLGLQIHLDERCALCRSCWTLTELLADFRTCCCKATEWRERFSFGITTKGSSREGWLKRMEEGAVAKMRTTILNHVERIEEAEVEARNEREMEKIVGPAEDSFQVDEQESTENKHGIVEQSVEMVETIKEIKVQSCPNCLQKFEGSNGMIIHLFYCKQSAPNKEKRRYTCTICSAGFKYQKQLQDHLNKHRGIKPYKCRKENCNTHSYTRGCGVLSPVCVRPKSMIKLSDQNCQTKTVRPQSKK